MQDTRYIVEPHDLREAVITFLEDIKNGKVHLRQIRKDIDIERNSFPGDRAGELVMEIRPSGHETFTFEVYRQR